MYCLILMIELEYDQEGYQQYADDSDFQNKESKQEEQNGVTQSHGFDMSVDTQALEEYDHVEDILPPH